MTEAREVSEREYLEKLEDLWEKNLPAGLPREPQYPIGKVLLTDYLRHWARETPDRPCVIFYGAELTFSQLDDLSDRFASFLVDRGFAKGDRVAVMMPNCPQFLIAFFGILKAGCVHVPVNPMFLEHEFLYEIQDSGAEAIVVLDLLFPVVQSTRDQTGLREILVTRLADYLPEEPTLPVPDLARAPAKECPGTLDFMTVLANRGREYPKVEVALDDLAALNYTGGTTGMPKGCEHTQWDMVYTAASFMTYTVGGSRPDDVLLSYLPIFWIAGEDVGILHPIFSGTTQVLFVRWDPLAAMKAVETYKVTLIIGLMDNFVQILEHPERDRFDLSSMRWTAGISFVKKLNAEYRREWKALTGSVIREAAYGMTETHTVDTFTTGMQDDDFDLVGRAGFVGLPVPPTKLKIVDFETGKIMPLGQEGQIAAKSPSMMKRYWNKPEASREQIIDGWLLTGDIGMIDEEGYVHYLGRTKEMLKVKGMSVFPSEIESLVARHPAVAGCGVVGRPDADKGEVAVAFVQLEPDHVGRVDEEELTAWCLKSMARYKVPEIRILDQLPLTSTGKVAKIELEKLL